MTRLFRAPGTYVQAPGALDEAAEYLGPLERERALVMGGETALSAAEGRLVSALDEAGIATGHVERGLDACTETEIDRGVDLVAEAGADLVVGAGGGTAIDAAKAVAARAGVGFVSVPTVASTDAPCSAISVVYDEDGRPGDAVIRDRNPEVVLVDTSLVAAAPERFLRYGMGDALATRFEAEAVSRSGASTIYGTTPTDAGLALARECFRTLDAHGADAREAIAGGQVTPAVEAVVEANLLLSGLGFENGGLAGAHAIDGACREAGTKAPHGVSVAFCTLAQLVLEDHEERDDVRGLIVELGLATSLERMGLDDRIEEVAKAACESGLMANEPFEVTPGGVADALRTADELLSE